MVNTIPSSISSQFKSSGVDPSNGPKGTTLAVSDKTTLKDLQAFLAQGKASQEVRGHMVHGSLVLYTKPANPKDPGGRIQTALNHFVSNSADQKRNLGKKGIETILKQHMGAERAATSSVTNALDTGVKSSVKVGSMIILAEIANRPQMDVAAPRNPGPSLSDTGMSKEKIANSMDAAVKLFNGNQTDEAVKLLGNDFAKAFEATHPDVNKRDAFALSMGKAFKQELGALFEANGVNQPSVSKDGLSLADKVYAAVASQVGRGNMNDAGELVIDTKSYVKVRNLAKGGNGSVDLYVNKNDPTDRLAFKVNFAGEGIAGKQTAMLVEIENHQHAYANDDKNIVALRAGVQLPDGMFGMAMEIAHFGDMQMALDILKTAEKSGDLSPSQAMAAKLTLLQDGLKGLQSLHEQGTAHRDVKPGNFFVFAGGVVKVADLGDVRNVQHYDIHDASGNTRSYAAPELDGKNILDALAKEPMSKMNASKLSNEITNNAKKDGRDISEEDKEKLKNWKKSDAQSPMYISVQNTLLEQMPKLNDASRKKLMSDLQATKRDETLNRKIDPLKRDAYAAGITAFQVASGDLPFANASDSAMLAFTDNPHSVLSRDAPNKVSVSGIKDNDLKNAVESVIKLADDLTSPDVTERLDVASALKSPAFKMSGVGSPETRKLIDTLLKKANNLGDDYLPLPAQTPDTASVAPMQVNPKPD